MGQRLQTWTHARTTAIGFGSIGWHFVVATAHRLASLSDKREGVTVNISIARYSVGQYIKLSPKT